MTEQVRNASLPVSLLDGSAKNYRSHPPEQVKQLVASLQRFSQVRSIVVKKQAGCDRYTILAGHGLVEAARECLYPELRCDIVPDSWDDMTCQAYLIADNNLSNGAVDDEELLAQLLQEQSDAGFDLASMGSDEETLRQMLESLGDGHLGEKEEGDGGDEFDITPEEGPTRTHVGELWALGEHRLLVGDSTDIANVRILMDGKKSQLVFEDPPYGVAYQDDMDLREAVVRHRRRDGLKIANDSMTHEQTFAFLCSAFTALRDCILLPGGSFYICSPAGDLETVFRNALDASGLKLRQCLVWAKNQFVFGRQDYHYRHESLLYGWNDGHAHYFVDDRTQDTVWEIDRPRRSDDHPTTKPLELPIRSINNSSKPHDLVFDGFLGSGTTLIAAQRTGRVCYGCEIDPHYADVILRRFTSESGIEPELIEQLEVQHA